MNRTNSLAAIISWGWSIGLIILNTYVFIKYCNRDISYLTLCGIIDIIDILFFSRGKGLSYFIPLALGSIIAIKNIWFGICFALVVENLISAIIAIITLIYCYIKIPKD